MILDIKQLDTELPLPTYAREGDAGLDLYATEEIFFSKGERYLMPTGIAIAIPEGFCGWIIPRSGLAATKGFTVVNAPGLIDSGYRGEIKVIMLNTDNHGHYIHRGDRVAQLVIQQVTPVDWNVVEELSDSVRGDGGLGHTGK